MAIHTLDWDAVPPADCRGGVVGFGNFDGVHRGHAALVAELRQKARALGGPAVAVTFDPHPMQLLRPEQFQPVLTTIGDRTRLLEHCGADHVIVLRTTSDLLNLAAADFFTQVVRARLAARAMVEGDNFAFGHNRAGNVATLRAFCREAGIDLDIVPPVKSPDGVPVSSSRVRSALVRGDVTGAQALMNHPYRLRGTVAAGQRRGQKLGFPTANLERIPTLIPGDGVYAVKGYHEGQVWPGAANIGPNPTFGEQARKVEVHLIGFQGDLYGRPLAMDFVARLRDTRPFAGVDQLVQQLRTDVEQARRLAGSPTRP